MNEQRLFISAWFYAPEDDEGDHYNSAEYDVYGHSPFQPEQIIHNACEPGAGHAAQTSECKEQAEQCTGTA